MGMRNPILATVIGALTSLLVCGWYYRNGSFDFGMHYAVVAYVFDHWRLPTSADTYLEVMSSYPPAAHAVAAAVGAIFGSPLVGMHLVTVLAIFASYASLFWLMRFRSARPIWLTYGATLAVLAATCRRPSLLGAEVVGNYFFAHICGTALFLTFTASQYRVHAAAAVVGVFLLGWVYPLSAVQLACVVTILMVLRRDGVLQVAAFMVCAAGAIYFHPLFQQSATNGSHNGDIGTGYLPNSSVYPATALLVLASGTLAVEYFRGRLKMISGPAFIATGLGVAAAAIVQMLAFHVAGKGAQYLVYKHLFLVATLLLMTSVALIAHVSHFEGGAQPRLAFAGFACLAVITMLIPMAGFSVRRAVATERAIKADPAALSLGTQFERHAFRAGILHVPLNEAFATR